MKKDLDQVLFNDRDHLESPNVTQAGLESNLELLQLLPVQDLLLSQSVQQPVPEKVFKSIKSMLTWDLPLGGLLLHIKKLVVQLVYLGFVQNLYPVEPISLSHF